MNLFDASALLIAVQGESGADVVERALQDGGAVSAANWSEVAQQIRSAGADWSLARALLLSYGLHVESVLEQDAERAAVLWRRGSGLSLADRLCLATGHRLDAIVWTADEAWGTAGAVRQVR